MCLSQSLKTIGWDKVLDQGLSHMAIPGVGGGSLSRESPVLRVREGRAVSQMVKKGQLEAGQAESQMSFTLWFISQQSSHVHRASS